MGVVCVGGKAEDVDDADVEVVMDEEEAEVRILNVMFSGVVQGR